MTHSGHPEPAPEDDDAPTRALTLPRFTPVPREKERSNGWKAEVQHAFIEALAETGSVKAACQRVNRADHGAYMLRRHPDAAEFRKAWDAALDIAMGRIEDVAMDRAINGVEQPIVYHGEILGTRQVYNDRLLMFMLRSRAPERFGGGLSSRANGPNAVDKMQLERMKKRWRREWEAERAEERREDSRAVIARIDAKFKLMAERRRAMMSPRTLALHDAFREAQEADREAREAREAHPLLPGVMWPYAWGPDDEEEEVENGEWSDAQ